jgi:hypothetical protein
MRGLTRGWAVAVVLVVMTLAPAVLAHEMAHRGTVQGVEAARVQVQTIDDAGAPAALVWYTVSEDTEVRRGDAVVTFTAAAVQVGERIVVIVDHDVDETAAIEVRLAAR